MKAMFAGFAAMIVLAIGGYFILENMHFSTAEVSSSDNVRLD
jgi:hypothetical protein